MPLFEYECPQCADRFELLVRHDTVVNCPKCGNERPTRLLSAPAVGRSSLPLVSGCAPADAPPCSPHCCRLNN